MNQFTEEFKENIIQKMCMPGGKSNKVLSEEIGVCEQTLYNWRKRIQTNVTMINDERRPKAWKISDKYDTLLETANKPDEEFGRMLREKGLQTTHIELWKQECKSMLSNNEYKKENKHLKQINQEQAKEINRKDKALAEVTALLVLKKKAKELLGDEYRGV